MNNSDINLFVQTLKSTYPDAACSLNFKTPFQLVVAVMLSAQCTDERVNKTTPVLFEKCKTIDDFANIDICELEDIVHPCGFYKNKAKNIKKCAKQVLDDFNGIVPQNMNDLLSLAGIGRKSANVIMLEAFGILNGIAVDTHAKRISNRIGLSSESDPEKIEKDLLKVFPKEILKDINHLLVWHGRNTCDSRKPKCDICTVKKYCDYYKTNKKNLKF